MRAPFTGVQAQGYANIMAALKGEKVYIAPMLINTAGLATAFSNPNTAITIFVSSSPGPRRAGVHEHAPTSVHAPIGLRQTRRMLTACTLAAACAGA